MNDYQERKRRERRVQYPPLSYWQQYEEQTQAEEEFCQTITRWMDKLMTPFLYLCLLGIAVLLIVHFGWYYIPVIGSVLTVAWWIGWGRKRYE